MSKKFEKSLDEKKMEVQSLQSNFVNNQVERPATIQKENNDIYKPYAYLFDYLYEPTQIQFNEEDSSAQTALFEHESSSQSIKNFEEHKIEEIKEETQCEEKSTDEQEEEKSQIIFNEKFELLESEDKQEENSTYLTKKEITNYMNLKDENKVKNEYKIKREYAVKSEGAQTREFMYVLSDEDDEVIYSGTTKKKVKLENNDVKGLFIFIF